MPPYIHYNQTTPGGEENVGGEESKEQEQVDGTMYAWSIYGALHAMNMRTF